MNQSFIFNNRNIEKENSDYIFNKDNNQLIKKNIKNNYNHNENGTYINKKISNIFNIIDSDDICKKEKESNNSTSSEEYKKITHIMMQLIYI